MVNEARGITNRQHELAALMAKAETDVLVGDLSARKPIGRNTICGAAEWTSFARQQRKKILQSFGGRQRSKRPAGPHDEHSNVRTS